MPVIKRLHYFDHQFLIESDFADHQAYHVDMRWRHNRLLHTAGVADGLLVTGAVGATSVSVAPGTAIDANGHDVVLLEARTLALPGTATAAEIYIAYREVESDPRSSADVTGNTRISEDPVLTARAIAPAPDPVPAGGVLLAAVSLSGGQLTAAPNNDVRTRAGSVVTDDLAVRSLRLRRDGLVSAQWPRLSCAQANQATLEGDLVFRATSGENAGDIMFQNAGGVQKGRIWTNPTAGAALFLSSGDVNPDVTIDPAGNVGIGTTAPTRRLTMEGPAGTYLNVRANGGTFELLLGADAGGGIVSTITNHDLQLRAGGNDTKVIVKADGKVGVGNTAPTHRLHVTGNLGLRQNRLYVTGGDGGLDNWSSISYNAHHNDTNNGWVFPDPTRKAVTMEMDDSGGTPRFQVWSTRAATPTGWVQRFAINGETGDVLMGQNGGTVGVGTPSVSATLDVHGSIRSPMWNLTNVFNNRAGSQPLNNGAFTAGGGTLLVFASGSGFSAAGAAQIGMNILIDGVQRGLMQSFTNEAGSHKAFVANPLVVTGLAAGPHTLALAARPGTGIDLNDFFSVTILELPWVQGFVFTPILVDPVILQPVFRPIP